MDQIFINVISSLIAAAIIGIFASKNKSSVIIVQRNRVGWFWKMLVLGGAFLFYFGLLVFVANLMVGGTNNPNTGIGLAMFTWGGLLWLIGRIVIFFKRN